MNKCVVIVCVVISGLNFLVHVRTPRCTHHTVDGIDIVDEYMRSDCVCGDFWMKVFSPRTYA